MSTGPKRQAKEDSRGKTGSREAGKRAGTPPVPPGDRRDRGDSRRRGPAQRLLLVVVVEPGGGVPDEHGQAAGRRPEGRTDRRNRFRQPPPPQRPDLPRHRPRAIPGTTPSPAGPPRPHRT